MPDATPVWHHHYTSIEGEEVPLRRYEGQVLLIVNVASRCGFTKQYTELQALWEAHAPAGLVVIGFPCNQFAGQEPGSNQDVQSFCTTRFGVTFPLAAKVNVNGPQAHPIFVSLAKALPGVLGTRRIKWNFTKFLVGRDGLPKHRFGPRTTPRDLEASVLAELAAPQPG